MRTTIDRRESHLQLPANGLRSLQLASLPPSSRCYFRKGVLGNRSNSSNPFPSAPMRRRRRRNFIYGMHLIWLSPPPDIKFRFVIGCPTVDTIVVLLLSPRVIVRVMTHLNNISTLLLHVLVGGTCQAEGDEGGINLPPNTGTRPH